MKRRGLRNEDGGWLARSVLECGGKRSATPLWHGGITAEERRRRFALPAQSQTWWGSTLYFCFLLSAFCFCAQAQYAINWHTVDGGGGTSTGGVYSVSGTIGQPDATTTTMTGGPYSLAGGFWAIYAVQTPGAPYLTITRSNTTVIVSWPLPAEGWVLEWTNRVDGVSAPWSQIPPPYPTNGSNLQFTEPSPVGNKFYRLHKP
jgi:hypothetical protein